MPSNSPNSAIPHKEKPTRISIGIDKSQLEASVTISSVYFEGEVPPECDPRSTLILPEIPCGERDRVLGAYLAKWNQIESINEFLVGQALKLQPWESAPVTTLGLNANAFQGLVNGLAEQQLTEADVQKINKYLEGYKVRNTKRNKIVHGTWTCSVKIGSNECKHPVVTCHEWLRTYTPNLASERKKLAKADLKALAKYSFSIKEIEKAIQELSQFHEDHHNIAKLFEGPPKEPVEKSP